jgi:hypothetical protein
MIIYYFLIVAFKNGIINYSRKLPHNFLFFEF